MFELAEDGMIAVEKVRSIMAFSAKNHYDAILMDFVMPHMDGPTATKNIRELFIYVYVYMYIYIYIYMYIYIYIYVE
jgi:CheY-like chemotaxis protein